MVVCDGLEGPAGGDRATWPAAVTQTCIVHLLRNSFRYASRRDWDAIAKELRAGLYRGDGGRRAGRGSPRSGARWEARYPAIVRLWEGAWAEFARSWGSIGRSGR